MRSPRRLREHARLILLQLSPWLPDGCSRLPGFVSLFVLDKKNPQTIMPLKKMIPRFRFLLFCSSFVSMQMWMSAPWLRPRACRPVGRTRYAVTLLAPSPAPAPPDTSWLKMDKAVQVRCRGGEGAFGALYWV